MTTPQTYTNIDRETRPVPPVNHLLSYVSLGNVDHQDLTPVQQSAVMDWWFVIDHPGFGGGPQVGDNLSSDAEHMRAAGFSEPDIRLSLLIFTMLKFFEHGPEHPLFERKVTDFLIELIEKAGDNK